MKIKLLSDLKTILSNPNSHHNYFAWSSLVRLRNGDIAVASSGFRLDHICPFGKGVIAFSQDEGETYSAPTPIIDTVLDDRDAGLCTFGDSGLILTSFNNTVAMQRICAHFRPENTSYISAYLDRITPEEEARDLGATFKISFDNGKTFGKMYKSPITSPHGPIELKDGKILWVGSEFSSDDSSEENNQIHAYYLDVNDGSMQYLSSIEPISENGTNLCSCEPYTIELKNGNLICHIRVQNSEKHDSVFTLYQTESYDKGKTWSKPHRIIEKTEGAPSHMLIHSSGRVICTYSHRTAPYGIHVIFSNDNCQTWSEAQVLYQDNLSSDIGYPTTVELKDGSLITAFYVHDGQNQPAVIKQQKWTFEN